MGTTTRNTLTHNRKCINKLIESTRGRTNSTTNVHPKNTDNHETEKDIT